MLLARYIYTWTCVLCLAKVEKMYGTCSSMFHYMCIYMLPSTHVLSVLQHFYIQYSHVKWDMIARCMHNKHRSCSLELCSFPTRHKISAVSVPSLSNKDTALKVSCWKYTITFLPWITLPVCGNTWHKYMYYLNKKGYEYLVRSQYLMRIETPLLLW